MLSSVLKGERAAQINIAIMRAFVKLRGLVSTHQDLAQKLAALEKDLKAKLSVHETIIIDILKRMMDVLNPPIEPEPEKPRIGFKP